ncbi:MAG TPA: hypothetical protein VMU82_07325 [Acetobacteraceae bacterium]|nr:hypothetical protein [Acetobacteraceae bacterium]
MRIVALEEHFTVPDLVARIDPAAIARRGFPPPSVVWSQVTKRGELADLDAAGIEPQILSASSGGGPSNV